MRKGSGKARAIDKEDLPMYALKRLEGPMVPPTETSAVVEDIGEFERQRAVEIVEAYRISTSQNKALCLHTNAIVSKALASGQSEQYVLEVLHKTFQQMQAEKSSAIPVL